MAQWWRMHLQHRGHEFHPWVRKILWRRKWQPTPVFLPGKFHGQRPGGPQSMESQRVGHALVTKQHYHLTWGHLPSDFLLCQIFKCLYNLSHCYFITCTLKIFNYICICHQKITINTIKGKQRLGKIFATYMMIRM